MILLALPRYSEKANSVSKDRVELADLGPLIEDTRERISMVKAAQNLPRTASPKTTLVTLNRAVIKERRTPSTTSALLKPVDWNFKQKEAGHGCPHGRYMWPSFQVFYPKNSTDEIRADTNPKFSPINILQAYLYVSYIY
jgi:hypothetical protein